MEQAQTCFGSVRAGVVGEPRMEEGVEEEGCDREREETGAGMMRMGKGRGGGVEREGERYESRNGSDWLLSGSRHPQRNCLTLRKRLQDMFRNTPHCCSTHLKAV